MNKKINNPSLNNDVSKVMSVIAGVLSVSVLAYCGYKIVNNQLSKSKYEPDPNKKCTK